MKDGRISWVSLVGAFGSLHMDGGDHLDQDDVERKLREQAVRRLVATVVRCWMLAHKREVRAPSVTGGKSFWKHDRTMKIFSDEQKEARRNTKEKRCEILSRTFFSMLMCNQTQSNDGKWLRHHWCRIIGRNKCQWSLVLYKLSHSDSNSIELVTKEAANSPNERKKSQVFWSLFICCARWIWR